jgi:hypothetical protein
MGDSIFSFRMRNSEFSNRIYIQKKAASIITEPPKSNAAFQNLDTSLPTYTDGYTYGYVFFRQEADNEVKRGFFQKSIVLLSPHPWPGMFLKVIELLGPKLMTSCIQDRRDNSSKEGSPPSKAHPGRAALSLLEQASFSVAAWLFI